MIAKEGLPALRRPRTGSAKSEFECLLRTLGKIGEGGVFVKAHPLWRTFLTTSAIREYVAHYHAERNHQEKSNVLLFPQVTEIRCDKAVECRERLGGLLRYHHRDGA
jgi:hypothetical protein